MFTLTDSISGDTVECFSEEDAIDLATYESDQAFTVESL